MASGFQNPVVVIPGITATDLLDDYPLKTEELWTMVFNKDYERIALHPDDLRYEASEPARVITGRAFPIYDDLVKSLRHELSRQADRATPVFAFPYDWRLDIATIAAGLGRFLEEVLARTRLLKHYARCDDLKVDLVGHSMGGLVIAEHLAQAGAKSCVGRVVTLGTPFRGSIEAVVKITTGMSLLSGGEPKERERETARATTSVYQLFPSYAGCAVDAKGKSIDLFQPKNMQTSVVDSLEEFVRRFSVRTSASDRRAKAESMLAEFLAKARAHRAKVETLRLSSARLKAEDWLAVVGVGEKTRVQMSADTSKAKLRFVIDDSQFVNELSADDPASHRTGDGTVPLSGAIAPFLKPENLVCVTRRDLSFWEVRDRLLVELGGFHGLLPKVNLVQRLTVRHLMGPAYHGKVWGRPLPGARRWSPPIPNLKQEGYADLESGHRKRAGGDDDIL